VWGRFYVFSFPCVYIIFVGFEKKKKKKKPKKNQKKFRKSKIQKDESLICG
jgi:hypothetical protein